uniref:Uncharacterized protein n=1 Tax=Rousettus aegyptiacus TaxID=9407 RepID=A0A7J8DXK3_ROUAE|nr:hypothetical protein HJG63_008396 [Rousettus aegyptiacus]
MKMFMCRRMRNEDIESLLLAWNDNSPCVCVCVCVCTHEPLLGSRKSNRCCREDLIETIGTEGGRLQAVTGPACYWFQGNVHLGPFLEDYVPRTIKFLKSSSTGDGFYFLVMKPRCPHEGLK